MGFATLSVFYGAQDLTQEQHSDLVDLLDALAREVIFSQRHLLDVKIDFVWMAFFICINVNVYICSFLIRKAEIFQ